MLGARLRRGFTALVVGLTVVSGTAISVLVSTPAHAGNNTVAPPVDACYYVAGFCNQVFMKAAIAPTLVVKPTSETDTTATFTFTSPSAGINTTTPVACGSAGCIFNHYDWNAYSLNAFRIVSGCGGNDDTCTVVIGRGSDSWVPLVASLNDFPTALYLMWDSAIPTGSVSGTVTDGLGKPVAGATVSIVGGATNLTGTTDAKGTYYWIVPANASYTLTVTDGAKTVYTPGPTVVAVGTTNTVHDFSLPLHKVSGRVLVDTCTVTSCSQKGTPGIKVTLAGISVGSTVVSQTATTSSSGSWSINVPNGTYSATPSKGSASFVPDERDVKVKADVGDQNFRVCSNALKHAGEGVKAGTTHALCPYGLDWTMPDRLTAEAADAWAGDKWGIAPHDQVYPDDFTANVFLTQGGAKLTPCPSGVTWTWSIAKRPGNSADARLANKTGCQVKLVTPTLGDYTLKAVAKDSRTKKVVTSFSDQVEVKDWLIGAVGDSNGSGEGNPPFFFKQCNRSLASYQYLTAKALEDADKRTSVTFVWASCSGAQVEDLVSRSYVGIDPAAGKPLPPQLKQLANRADPIDSSRAKRTYDAVLTSIGVNNLGFGGVLKFCSFTTLAHFFQDQESGQAPNIWPSCMSVPVSPTKDKYGTTTFVGGTPTATAPLPTLDSYVRGKLDQLTGEYASYKVALRKDLPKVQPKHVIMTTYPDFSYGNGNAVCGGSAYTMMSNTVPPFTSSEWSWLSQMGSILNHQVDLSASDGFTPVDGIAQEFYGHGYCATDSYIRTVVGANRLKNPDGPFHPTQVGHQKAELHNFPALCQVLYKTNDCKPV